MMQRMAAGLVAIGLTLGSATPGVATAAGAEDEAGGWYAGLTARAFKAEGWQAGHGAGLLVGWMLPYRHSGTPDSSVAIEGEFAGTLDDLSRRNGGRETAGIRQGAVALALNTQVGEAFFHRVRLGGVVRDFRRGSGGRIQTRALFGLGAGVRLGQRVDILLDAQTQFARFPDDQLFELGVSTRWYF